MKSESIFGFEAAVLEVWFFKVERIAYKAVNYLNDKFGVASIPVFVQFPF